MSLPNPPWYRRWSFILAGVIGLAAIAALVGWRGLQEFPPDTTRPTVAVSTSTTTTTPPTSLQPPTTTSRRPGVLWTETGSDAAKSSGFRAPRRWRIEWSFDCSNFRGLGGGNFKITGDGAFGRVEIQDFAVEASGAREFASGGYGHLLVDSVCRTWTVTVTDA